MDVLLFEAINKAKKLEIISYQDTENSRFGFYDLWKEKIFFSNTDGSILDRREDKIQ